LTRSPDSGATCGYMLALCKPSSAYWSSANTVFVYLQLFVGGLMSHWRYLCLLAFSGVQHILCYVFVLFVFVLRTLCC